MSKARFEELMGELAASIDERMVDAALASFLNASLPADDEPFGEIQALCAEGERDGWICEREAGGIKFGRVIKPPGRFGKRP